MLPLNNLHWDRIAVPREDSEAQGKIAKSDNKSIFTVLCLAEAKIMSRVFSWLPLLNRQPGGLKKIKHYQMKLLIPLSA